ncbi:hypothetical protein YK48G_05040 [Lentilactobacillus fungorum]|jgi:hypothetical protein|uniref:Uncharacterized protein n=1 Tax=Lentilactobacillus fungorum TaxID=2201250 RepID=A0ABQ3VXL6_9LACO|nr:hypothetical protein [Lentilactobacillus fungorum]GHP13079.1 hypothetical protein YK48G_05040 [Lentilactobacillus fungorum]
MTLLILALAAIAGYYYFKNNQSKPRNNRYQNTQGPNAYAYARNEHPEILDKGQGTGRPRKNIN